MKVNYQTSLAAAAVLLFCAASARADEAAVAPTATDAGAAPLAPSSTASVASVPATAPVPTDAGAAALVPATSASVASVAMPSEDLATYYNDCDPLRDFDARVGGWYVHQTGSPTKVDQYQDRNSSVFFDVEGIMSDGDRSLDFSVWQADNDDQYGRLHFYGGPRLEADVMWEQFPDQLYQYNYPGWVTSTASPPINSTTGAGFNVYSRKNFNVGQDYAIDVQEYKANFQGCVTDNLRWYVKAFGIDKEGLRQANAFTHCANTSQTSPGSMPNTGNVTSNPTQCHAVSQAQHIDWQTNECEVGLQLKMGCDTSLAYSHLVRAFNQNDQQVWNVYRYSATPAATGQLGFTNYPGFTVPGNTFSTAGYNIVPDNQTQIDRLKFSTRLGDCNDVYLLGYAGYNEDLLTDAYRNFNGVDLRITNHRLEHWDVTGYAKYYREDSTSPLEALNTKYPTPAQEQFLQESSLTYTGSPGQFIITDPLVDREVHGFGVDGRWKPFEDECDSLRRNLNFTVGYDYNEMLYQNAGDNIYGVHSGPFLGAPIPFKVGANTIWLTPFTQPNTVANTFTLGVEEKWSRSFDTQLRYKYINTYYPLYGITPDVISANSGSAVPPAATSADYALNTSLPTQENRIEFQTTWTPTDCLMVNATFYVENAMSNAVYAGNSTVPNVFPGWTSNSLPFTISAWWAPTCDWSFNGGVSEMDNWINQGVNAAPVVGSVDAWGAVPVAQGTNSRVGIPANYRGSSDVLTFGTRYQASCKLAFTAMFEYERGSDFTNLPVTPTAAGVAPYNLGQYSLVRERSFRIELGADYRITQNVTTYLRFDYYDYQDLVPVSISGGSLSGQQDMLLGGISAKF